MSETTISTLPDPSGFSPDPLTDLIREGARKLIEQAVEAELATLLAAFAEERLDDGRARLVRHGHLPEREILTGIGPVAVKVPRVRDRKPGAERISFTPSILPRYLRKAKSVEELLPWLGSVAKFCSGRVGPSFGRSYAAARLSSMIATASAITQGPTPKARSIMRFSPMGSRVRLKARPWPFRRARITSNPLIVA